MKRLDLHLLLAFFAPLFLKKHILLFLISFGTVSLMAQNDVMLQAFYWDVPVNAEQKDGFWWDNLSNKAPAFKKMGITAIWVPPPSKGNWGIIDMGYGLYDHYDLGNYNQKGSVETRFGSRSELESMMAAMHDTAHQQPKIEVYADIILNHMYGSGENAEANPAVKQYVFDEAFRNGSQFTPYPTNEITWIIPNATAGDYYIKIKGYCLDFNAPAATRGYDLQIDYQQTGFNQNYSWEAELNGGQGQANNFPASGETVRAFIDDINDIDEFKITAPGGENIIIKITSRVQSEDEWNWGDQTKGYYPYEIGHNGKNLASSVLEAHTNTALSYPVHTGPFEQNWTWNYSHFHPVDDNDWLGDWGESDEIIPNTKGYGNDLNTFSEEVQQRMNTWGIWLADMIKFDGFRLDFVRGFQESYAANWINNLPPKNDQQRFIVSEYWGSEKTIQNWVNTVNSHGAKSSAFDFPLKTVLTELCNTDSGFDMSRLNHAGLVRNSEGSHLPASSVVTFLENHDTGKEHDKWVTKDWHLGYAYLLTHEGRPCLFYPHLYGVQLYDYENPVHNIDIPDSLKKELLNLISIRSTYLGGSLTVLSQVGAPYPAKDVSDVYVARRAGNKDKEGAIIVINNCDTVKGLWVDSSPEGWSLWADKTLVNALDHTQSTKVNQDGRVWIEAPARSYSIYVLNEDFEPLANHPGN